MTSVKAPNEKTPVDYWPTRQLLRLMVKLYVIDVYDYSYALSHKFPTQ